MSSRTGQLDGHKSCSGSCSKPQQLPKGYDAVRTICGLAIAVLSIKAQPKVFLACAAMGFTAQYFAPWLSKDLRAAEACVSGCTDIVGHCNFVGLDPRLSAAVATLFFCCHLEHHGREMVPVAGMIFGFRMLHSLNSYRN